MSEELIPPFTGPMSKETAQYRAKQAVEYYHRQVRYQGANSPRDKVDLPKRNNRDRQDAREQRDRDHDRVNGYRVQYENKNVNVDVGHSSQGHRYDPLPADRFVRGGHRATVHGTNSGAQWQQNNSVSNAQNSRHVLLEHRSGSKKRQSRGLHRSNSNLEESMEYINVEHLDNPMTARREYGSTSSLDMMNASTSSDSFFQMLENLRPANVDQRSPAPMKLQEVLRGPKADDKTQFLRNLEKIANGSVINQRPSSDELDDGSQSPRSRKKDRKLRSKSITPEVGPGVWRRIRGKNEPEATGAKTGDTVPDLELKGDERFRRKAFVHYDCQSIGFDVNKVLKSRKSVTNFSNISTGASAASGTRESFAGDAEAPDIGSNTDDGDGQSNDLVQSCSFFRNEIGGEEERIVGLTHSAAKTKASHTNREKSLNRSAITLNRSPDCCGVTILDCSPTSVGHILPPHTKHKDHVIEYVDSGAYYYRHFFNGQGKHFMYLSLGDHSIYTSS